MNYSGTTITAIGIGTNIFMAAAIAPMSAPALTVLGIMFFEHAGQATTRHHGDLAQMNCIAVIIGNVISAIHSVEKPVDAPVTVYVPMPEGSSSDAPVIKPGPRMLSTC